MHQKEKWRNLYGVDSSSCNAPEPQVRDFLRRFSGSIALLTEIQDAACGAFYQIEKGKQQARIVTPLASIERSSFAATLSSFSYYAERTFTSAP
jgi:hypothetical protein